MPKYGPQIVTDGLVLHLDAGNRKSYPLSGNTIYDLSGNGNNGTFGASTAAPTFSGDNGGFLIFDGSNDYINFFAPNLGTIASVEMWVNLGASYSGKMFFGWAGYDVWCNAGRLGYNTSNSDVYGISSETVSSLGLVNNWRHYIFEMRSDVSYTNNKIYINTVSQTLSQQQGGENSSYRNFNSGNGRISGWRNDYSYSINMNCASFKVYNRALTTKEITQNYTALKGRFGL